MDLILYLAAFKLFPHDLFPNISCFLCVKSLFQSSVSGNLLTLNTDFTNKRTQACLSCVVLLENVNVMIYFLVFCWCRSSAQSERPNQV